MTSSNTLVAGIGNIFLGDDGFGVAVVARLIEAPLPAHVRVLDIGIRARHLAYELLDGGYGTAILIDAVARGGRPGTLYVIEPDIAGDETEAAVISDGHAIDPEVTMRFLRAVGGGPQRYLILGCEPACVDDGMGLSPEVAAAVDEAVVIVRELVCA